MQRTLPGGHTPDLSAIVVIGERRERALRVLQALGAQSAVERMQIVVVDLAANEGRPPTNARCPVVYIPLRAAESFGRARVVGVEASTAPIAAFIEEHCYPGPGWAEALIETYQGPWAAVGYALTVANPESYVGRACGVVEYVAWLAPAEGGPTRWLPSHNVSYRRDVLISFGERLERLLNPDFNLHVALRRAGHRLYAEPRALVEHESFTSLRSLVETQVAFMRMLAARRVECGGWGWTKRVLFGLVAPVGVPVITTARFANIVRRRPDLWPSVLAALPVYLLLRVASGVAESVGYVAGIGDSERTVKRGELALPRAKNA